RRADKLHDDREDVLVIRPACEAGLSRLCVTALRVFARSAIFAFWTGWPPRREQVAHLDVNSPPGVPSRDPEGPMLPSRASRCAVFVMCLPLFIAPSPAFAQATGAIAGLVTDPSGGVLPGATIEVVSRDTGQVRNAVTGPDGFFNVPLVNPGLYRVTATLSGFRTTARETVRVVVNETVRADLSMPVGGLSETLVIAAESPLVETTNATLGVVIDRQKVVDLPLN